MNRFLLRFLSLFMSNEQLVEFQLKRQFKAPKMPKKMICEYCGSELIRGKDNIARWVTSDGKATYHHSMCYEKIYEARCESIKDFCSSYLFGYEPSIERCLACNQKNECEEKQKNAETAMSLTLKEKLK